MKLLFEFGVKRVLRILKWKWIKGNCRHICDLCRFSSVCFTDLDM